MQDLNGNPIPDEWNKRPSTLLPPDLEREFRRFLARSGTPETCRYCDVNRWTARWLVLSTQVLIAKVCEHCARIDLFDPAIAGLSRRPLAECEGWPMVDLLRQSKPA